MNILKYDTKYTIHIDQSGLTNALIEIINTIEEKNITIVSNDKFVYVYAKDGTDDKYLLYRETIEFILNINHIDYKAYDM